MKTNERVACPLCGTQLKPLSLRTHLKRKGIGQGEILRRWPDLHQLICNADAVRNDTQRHALEDMIQCLICGARRHNLGRHLASHGLNSKTYREQFPEADISSPHNNAIKLDLYVDRFGPAYWTRERIIAALRKYQNRVGRAPRPTDWRLSSSRRWQWGDAPGSRPATKHVLRMFGSWSAALEAAELAPSRKHVRCKHGHSLTNPINIYIHPKTGQRECRACWARHLRNRRAETAKKRQDAGLKPYKRVAKQEVRKIRRRAAAGETQRQIANFYGVSQSTISRIVQR